MSKPFAWTVTVAVALSACAVAIVVMAQDSSPRPVTRVAAGPTVALLDIGYVLTNSARFKASMEDLKVDVERFKADARKQKESIVQLSAKLQEYRSGTPDYEALDAEIAKRQADFTATLQLRNRDFGRRESRIWYDVYKEVCDVTNAYIQQHNIDMVLRFSGNAVEPEQIDSVRDFIGRPVVSYRTDLDITPTILQYVNRPAPNRAAPDRLPRESSR